MKTGRVSHCCIAAFTSAGVTRRIGVEVLLVEVGVADEDLALGQRDGLAAEAADLLEAADAAGDLARRGAAHFILGRAVGDDSRR